MQFDSIDLYLFKHTYISSNSRLPDGSKKKLKIMLTYLVSTIMRYEKEEIPKQ